MPTLNYEIRNPQLLNRITESHSISEHNEEILLKFHRDLGVENLSKARIYKLLQHLKTITEKADFDLDKATEEDIRGIVAWINSKDLAEATKRDYKVVIKQFYKWLDGGLQSDHYPEKVRFIKTTLKRKDHKLPEGLLVEDDVISMIKHCNHNRDKAFISLLWESGARIGELIDLKIGSFEDHPHGKKLILSGKTGQRKILLITSIPHIQSWINSHPGGDNPEAPLWVNIGNTNFGAKMSYRSILKMLNETGRRAEITKHLNPHHWRHSRLTWLVAKYGWGEYQLSQYAGWVMGSNQPARYLHLSGADMDSAILQMAGIEEESKLKPSKLAPKNCPRCAEKVSAEAKFCYRCGMALSIEAVAQIEDEEEQLTKEFPGLAQQDPDLLHDMGDLVEALKFFKENKGLLDDFKKMKEEMVSQ